MDIDTIILAVIAVLLFARLWTVLGRRNDEDKLRPNPFLAPLFPAQNKKEQDPKKEPVRELPPLLQSFKAPPTSLAGGLEQIKHRDPAFDEKQFLQTAKLHFTLIVEDFAKGDLTQITSLLAPAVAAHFQTALEARNKAGQKAESKIISIKEADTDAARLDGDQARITVRFVSIQENILRDANGQVIGGAPGKREEVTDLWTFTRDMVVADANWLLAETGA